MIDYQRFAFVIQTDHKGMPSTTEWNAHASLAEIAQALCDNDLPDCPVVSIIECSPSEGWSRDVTEDVARLIPAICDEAEREGWNVRPYALELMGRYIKARKLEAA